MRFLQWLSIGVLLASSSAWAADQVAVFEMGRWVMEQQRDFHRELARLIQSLARQEDPLLIGSLMVASFLYGVFHAAGPGHGKAVIASYMLATKAPFRKGVQLAFSSALLQGIVAIALVFMLSQVFALAGMVTETTRVLEMASYIAIGAIGMWMLWRIARGKSSCGHDHSHSHDAGAHCEHDHHHDSSCHHGSKVDKTAQRSTWAMVTAIGIRPCTGAVLVLLFSTSTDILHWGMVATMVMALGTAITVSALALISVALRDASIGLTPSVWRTRLTQILGVIAALLLIFISVTMIYSDLQIAGRAF